MGAHALLVGISQFDDPKLAKLNSPQSDVEAFAGVLKDPTRGGFDSVSVSIDQDVLTIRDQLSALMDGRSADDMVLLYYSGHGGLADKNFRKLMGVEVDETFVGGLAKNRHNNLSIPPVQKIRHANCIRKKVAAVRLALISGTRRPNH
jgi:Caspase domain